MKLLVCMPARSFTSFTVYSLLQLQKYFHLRNINAQFVISRGCNIYSLRNECIDVGLKFEETISGIEKYDFILWIDSDMVFTEFQFIHLYNALLENEKIDIITGLYKTEGGINFVCALEPEIDSWVTLMTESQIHRAQSTPFEIAYAGFGFLMMRRAVFDVLFYPYFREVYQLINNRNEFLGEDFSFCHMIRQSGKTIYAHPMCIVGHCKEQIL